MIIYKAINTKNNKVYIGQTVNSLKHRSEQHRRDAKSDKRKHTYFHNAIRKHGFDAFRFECLEETDSIEHLNEREAYWISVYDSTNRCKGYNLDSGGKNCTKSERTKQRIGQTTLQKWNDPVMAQQMLDGLRKGTEVWQQQCYDNRVRFVCPVCGKELLLPPHLARQKNYCSYECAKVCNADVCRENFKLASKINHQRKVTQNEQVSKIIYEWCLQNAEVVLHCPKNKISDSLSGLYDLISEQFGIKDWRTICESVGVRYKKDFLGHLQAYICENVC